MTNEEQRIEIAQACGWKAEKRKRYAGMDNVLGWGLNSHLSLGSAERKFVMSPEEFPDYLHDLNAMHEAEGQLERLGHNQPSLAYEYDQKWLPIVTEAWDRDTGLLNTWKLFRATAAQRAEAFLRSVGKWKDCLVQQGEARHGDHGEHACRPVKILVDACA